MNLTINIPEWFGWIGVFFVALYAFISLYDRYWEHQERKRYLEFRVPKRH